MKNLKNQSLVLLALMLLLTAACQQSSPSIPNSEAGFATSYYDVTLSQDIPHGSSILNKKCAVIFNYPDGSYSHLYTGNVFAWISRNQIRMSSAYLNIEDAWTGASGGTLYIYVEKGNTLTYSIINFQNVTNNASSQAAESTAVSFNDVQQFIENQLINDLNQLFYHWQKNPLARPLFRPESDWFYEGTIQGQVLCQIQNYISNAGDLNRWLLLQEQPYTNIPDNRADILIISPNQEVIVIEVKADFIKKSAENDYYKLAIGIPQDQLGIVLFCANQNDVQRWEKDINRNKFPHVMAKGIGRRR